MAKVQPRSRRPGLLGTVESAEGPRLHIGVAEAAEGGRANRAACATLARALEPVRCRWKHRAGSMSLFDRAIHVSGDSACDDHALGVPPSAVQIIAGSASRQKRLLVTGDPAVITARLALL